MVSTLIHTLLNDIIIIPIVIPLSGTAHIFLTTSLFSVHKNMEGWRIGQLSPNCHINSWYCYTRPCQCDSSTKYQIWMIFSVDELQQFVHSPISFPCLCFSFHSTLTMFTSIITLQNNISYFQMMYLSNKNF